MLSSLFLAFLAACSPEDGSIALSVDAGPSVVGAVGDAYVFDGSDSRALSWSWRLGGVPQGSLLGPDDLIDADTLEPVLLPDVPGRYDLVLEACDVYGDCEESDTWAFATENAETRIAVPIADAGVNASMSLGALASLSGAGSSGTGTLRYAWTSRSRPACSILLSADIQRRTTAAAQALPDCEGSFEFRLRVTDANGTSATDVVSFQVGPGNAPPRAAATASVSAASVGQTIALDGTQSYDPSGEAITYQWSFQSKPSGSTLANSAISGRYASNASFVPDVGGNYVLKVTVRDSLNADVAYTSLVCVADDDWPC